MSVLSYVFFQAEDGIRDLVRSRGLGDVYKRQALACGWLIERLFFARLLGESVFSMVMVTIGLVIPVSYTHLTLPTRDLV